MFRVYTVMLSLQFVYTPRCTQTRFAMYLLDMHVCFCHTYSAYTSTLRESFYIINLASGHMPARMQNEKRVLSNTYVPHACLVNFKLSCTVCIRFWRPLLFSCTKKCRRERISERIRPHMAYYSHIAK